MVELIIRARAAPASPKQFAAAIGGSEGVEYLADIIRNSLFVSKGHRDDVLLHLVLEKSADFSRVVSFTGDELGTIGGLHEKHLLALIMTALEAGVGLEKARQVNAAPGISVAAMSFEHLVKEKAQAKSVYLLDRKGEDIRDCGLNNESVFVMTDHTPMPKKTHRSMARQGVTPVSLGPVMLHASQCISIIHNELDRQQP